MGPCGFKRDENVFFCQENIPSGETPLQEDVENHRSSVNESICIFHSGDGKSMSIPKGWLSLAPPGSQETKQVQICLGSFKKRKTEGSSCQYSGKSATGSAGMENSERGHMALDKLPLDCLVNLCGRIRVEEKCSLSLVSKKLNQASSMSTKFIRLAKYRGDIAFKGILSRFCNLSSFELPFEKHGCLFTDESCRVLAKNISCLEYIKLIRHPRITDNGISFITQSSSKLQHIDLTGCVSLTDHCLASIASYCPKVQSLKISHCKGFSSKGVEIISKKCELLETLEISEFDSLRGAWTSLKDLTVFCNACECSTLIKDIAVYCQNLRILRLVFFCNLGSLLEEIRDSCKQLTSLSLESCNGVKNEAFSSPWPNLTSLTLQSIDITDHFLTELGNNCPDLVKLGIQSCSLVTNIGVSTVLGSCSRLQVMDVSQCPRVTQSEVVAMATRKGRSLLEIVLPRQCFGQKYLRVVGKHKWRLTDDINTHWKLCRDEPCTCESCS